MAQTLLWYDLETFGRNSRYDRIAQYASIRTDDKFNQIGEPTVLFCKPSDDYLPDPYACLLTKITPQKADAEGINEYFFIQKIREEMMTPGTTVVGYNNLRFDDEFIRNALYRNFFDPYEREYKNNNSRWDIIDLVRAVKDLRPEGINWPQNEKGNDSLKLEHLSKANGLSHDQAHDALWDVKATIELASLVKAKNPKLFSFYYHLRKKDEVRNLLDLGKKPILVHSSGMFSSASGSTRLVCPIGSDPVNRNLIYTYDLSFDPQNLIDLDTNELRKRLFSPKEELPNEDERIHIKGIHLNRCPFLAPLSTLSETDAKRLGIDIAKAEHYREKLFANPSILQKVLSIFSVHTGNEEKDVDMQIYDAFFPNEDREQFEKIHKKVAELKLSGLPIIPPQRASQLFSLSKELDFQDSRASGLLRRFIARNFPEAMGNSQQKQWKNFCAVRLVTPQVEDAYDILKYQKVVSEQIQSIQTSPEQKLVLKELSDYAKSLKKKHLSS
jgi:exodeoxyribonuclease-1